MSSKEKVTEVPKVRVNAKTGNLIFYINKTSPTVIDLNQLRAIRITGGTSSGDVYFRIFMKDDKEYEYTLSKLLANSIIWEFDMFITM